MTRLLWLVALPLAAFVAAVGLLVVPAAPAGTGGLSCSKDTNLFYGLDNAYHPGEIGFRQSVACDQYTNISATGCLEKADGFGGWVNPPPDPCDSTSRESTLALGIRLWFFCTVITQTDSATYRGRSVFSVSNYGLIGVVTDPHGSRCLGPFLDTASSSS